MQLGAMTTHTTINRPFCRAMNPAGETREQRAELTKRALAEIVRKRIAARRIRQTDVARWSGVSRSFVQSILRAQRDGSLSMFLELSRGLAADPCELLREVVNRRDALRHCRTRGIQGSG
jgi:plasmid maintenance system antidote protein VapI